MEDRVLDFLSVMVHLIMVVDITIAYMIHSIVIFMILLVTLTPIDHDSITHFTVQGSVTEGMVSDHDIQAIMLITAVTIMDTTTDQVKDPV